MSRNHAWAYPTFLFLVAILLPANSWAQGFTPSEKNSGGTMLDVDPAALSLGGTDPSNWVDLSEAEVKRLFPSYGVSHRSGSDLYKLNFALPKDWKEKFKVIKVVDKASGVSGFRVQIKTGVSLTDADIEKAGKDCEGADKRTLCMSANQAYNDATVINFASEGFKGKLGLLQYVHNWGEGQLYHYGVGEDNISVLTADERERARIAEVAAGRKEALAHNRAVIEACLEEGDHKRAAELADELGIRLDGDLADQLAEAQLESAKEEFDEELKELADYIEKRGNYANLRRIYSKIDKLGRDIRATDSELYDDLKDQLDSLRVSSVNVATKKAKSSREVESIQRFAVSQARSHDAVRDSIAKISSNSLAAFMKKCGHKSECYDDGKSMLTSTADRLKYVIDESEVAKLQAGEDKLEQAEFLTAYVRQDPQYLQRGIFSGSLFDERAEALQTDLLEKCYGYSSSSFLIFSFYTYDVPSRGDEDFDDMMHQCGRAKSKLQAFASIPYEAQAMAQRMAVANSGVQFPNGVTSLAGLAGAGRPQLVPGQIAGQSYAPFIMPNQATAYNPQAGLLPQQNGMFPQVANGQVYNPQLGLYPQTGAFGQPQMLAGAGYQPQLMAQNNGLPNLSPQMTQPGMGQNQYVGRFFNPQNGGRSALTLTDPAFIRNTGRSSLFNFGKGSALFPSVI